MSRNNQVSRILRVLHYLDLHPHGVRARDILNKLHDDGFRCSRETVYRDLSALQQAHIPLAQEGSGETSVWKLFNVVKVDRNISFSYNELLALFISRESLKALHNSPIGELLEQFFLKLEKILGSKAHVALEEFAQSLGFKAKASWQTRVPQEVLDTIHSACIEGHLLEIEYQSVSGERAGKTRPRLVGPESIYFADSGVYLIAKEIKTGLHKTYSLNRVKIAKMQDEPYESHGFSVEDFFKNSLGVFNHGHLSQVEILILEPLASYVSERRWHESQEVIRTRDGIRLKMNVMVNDELARWVLGLGSLATVVGPDNLKALVQSISKDVFEKYNKKAT